MSDDYSIEKNKKYTLKLRKLLEELPVSCSEYFRGIESSSSVMTRYGYALDLRLFLNSFWEQKSVKVLIQFVILITVFSTKLKPIMLNVFGIHFTIPVG